MGSQSDAIVVAEGHATAATLKSLHAEAGDPRLAVAFVAAFDAGNVPHVARVLRERHLSAAMVIAADNDKAMEGQEVGRNPGLIKGQRAAEGAGAVLMAPSFSEEEVQAGFTDWNDLASHDEARAALVAKELENALVKALERARHRDPALDVDGNTELENASEREDEEPSADQNISSGVTVQNEQKVFFSLGKNGVNEYVRTTDGRFGLLEGGEKLRILNEDHQGATPEKNIAGNTATPEEARVDSGEAEQEPGWLLSSGDSQKEQKPVLNRGRSIVTSEQEQTAAKNGDAGVASGSTPERKTAVQPDGNRARQHAGEVFVDCGSAPYDFDKKNETSFFVRTVTAEGQQRVYWGKDFPRALEEAGAKVGDSITATRVASKPVTVEEIQEQPDGSRQIVRIDAKRNSWQVDNHGVNREALTRAYNVLVKSPEDRKKLERTAPLLVAARDKAVVEQKRERLQQELASRSDRQSNRLRI